MSVGVSLANILRQGFFAYTNNEKGHTITRADRNVREVVSDCQSASLTGKVAKVVGENTKVGRSVAEVLSGTAKTGIAFKYLSKGLNFASDAVNPLLVVASAARVYSADDKKSALIQEGMAMTAMFSAEGFVKSIFGLTGKTPTLQNHKLLSKFASKVTKFCETNKVLSHLPQGKLKGVIKAATFIAASCSAFAAGSGVGKYIADNTTARAYQKEQLEKAKAQYAQTQNIIQTQNQTGAPQLSNIVA